MRKFCVIIQQIFQRLIETLVEKVVRKCLMDLHLSVTTAEIFFCRADRQKRHIESCSGVPGSCIILMIKTWLLLKIILSLRETYFLLYILILRLQHPQIIISIQNKRKCSLYLTLCLLSSKIKYSENNLFFF